ncbi:MAG: hypothetical protein IIA70_08570 [Proteobacteria bacterium]|nr:hypothetical protein [Pseudomonadota bacterium]
MTRSLRFPVIALIILAVGSIGFGADAYAAKKKKIDRRVVEALDNSARGAGGFVVRGRRFIIAADRHVFGGPSRAGERENADG